MNDLRRIGFLALANVTSTLAWICLEYAGTGTGSHVHTAEALGDILAFLSAGYGILTIALALRAFDRFDPMSGRALQVSLSAAGFFAALPLGIIFQLGDAPGVITAGACMLAILPWVRPMAQVHGPEG